MKLKMSLLAILCFGLLHAQDSTVVKVEAPKIVSNLQLGKTITVNDVEIKFVEVVQDSRCPKNVNCVWAGEVIILVDVFKNGEFLEHKKITYGRQQDFLGNLFNSEKLAVSGLKVLPYPVNGTKIKPEDYSIQVEVRN